MIASVARLVSRISLLEGPEMVLHLAVNVMPGFHWQTQVLKRVRDLNCILISVMKVKNLKFSLLVFSLKTD